MLQSVNRYDINRKCNDFKSQRVLIMSHLKNREERNMLVDRRHTNRCNVFLSKKERMDILKEGHVFDFHLPDISGNFLPYNENQTVLYIYHMDEKLALTIVSKEYVHNWVRDPYELVKHLSSPLIKYNVSEKVLAQLQYKAPTIYRLLKLKLVTSDVSTNQEESKLA